jgi:hypothetical protein
MAMAHEWSGDMPQETCAARVQAGRAVKIIGNLLTSINSVITLFPARAL